jgi:hypothetical protein
LGQQKPFLGQHKNTTISLGMDDHSLSSLDENHPKQIWKWPKG